MDFKAVLGEVVFFVSALGILSGGAAMIRRAIVKGLSPLHKLNDATRAMLQFNLARAHRDYMGDKFIDRYALETVYDMYMAYQELGGNGFITRLVRDLEALPISMPGVRGEEVDNILQKRERIVKAVEQAEKENGGGV